MQSHLRSWYTDSTANPQLAEVVETAISRLEDGESVDVEALAAAHPEFASELRELLLTAGLIAPPRRWRRRWTPVAPSSR